MSIVRAPAPVAAFSLLICLLAGLVGGFGVGYGIAQREANATLERIASTRETAPPQAPQDDEPEVLGNVSPAAALQDAVSYARRGPANAKVEVVVFSDPRCPYCRQLAREVEPKLIEQYGDQIAITYRHFAILGEDSRRAAVALDCAGQAGKFWDYHALIYAETPPQTSQESLTALAKQIGLDEARFAACLDAPNRQVDVDFEVARALRVRGTPATFINGVRLNGALPLEYFTAAIDEQLRLAEGGR